MFKYQLLDAFVNEYSHLPPQGSDEWKKLRENFIGGSELSTVLKQNKNKSVTKLMLEKLGFDRFQGNAITHWGNVFEELIRQHCEEVFGCSIKETGSIPYKDGYLSYSPDGLAVVPTNRLLKQFKKLEPGVDKTSPTQLVLFEFKCPHSRLPSYEIPEHYLPQVKVGMNIIDIMETAVFVQSVYRRCSFEQLKYNCDHNPYGHFKRADTTNDPIEYGFMIIYAIEASEYSESLYSIVSETTDATIIHLKTGQEILDLGSMSDANLFGEILGGCVAKYFKVDYAFRKTFEQSVFGDPYKKDMYDISAQYNAKKCLEEKSKTIDNIIGIVPFKMMSVFMTPVEKTNTYIEDNDAHNKAMKVIDCINDHRSFDDKATASKSIRKYKL